MYSTEGKIKEPNLALEVGQGLFGMAKAYAQKDMGSVLKGAMGLFKTATGSTQKAEEYSRRTRTSPADAVSNFPQAKNGGLLTIIPSLSFRVIRSRGADVRTRKRAPTRSRRVPLPVR